MSIFARGDDKPLNTLIREAFGYMGAAKTDTDRRERAREARAIAKTILGPLAESEVEQATADVDTTTQSSPDEVTQDVEPMPMPRSLRPLSPKTRAAITAAERWDADQQALDEHLTGRSA